MATKPRLLIAALLAFVLLAGGAVIVGFVHRHNAASSSTGTGLTYQGRFYWASGQEVRPQALGAPLASGVHFQDTLADLRLISGFDPKQTIAALLPSLNGSPGGLRWTLISTDSKRGTNPAAYPDTNAVIVPT
jgi:hypothetical protein